MVVVAIIGILMIVALPAYNNYSLKSKFSEVVLATAPTKTAISTCSVSGDCVSGNAISLGTSAASGPPPTLAMLAASPGNQMTAVNRNPALIYAVVAASYLDGGYPLATATRVAQSFADGVIAGNTPYIAISSPFASGQFCLGQYDNPGQCDLLNATAATTQAYLTAANNPYFATSSGSAATLANLPCVGAVGCSPATKYVASVSYDAMGVITATAASANGLKSETFMLTPQLSGGRVDWMVSGSCKTRAGGALC